MYELAGCEYYKYFCEKLDFSVMRLLCFPNLSIQVLVMVINIARLWCSETQLRPFYSTTQEISMLFAKQQEQLKSMQRTLEDEENYETTSADIDLNPNIVNVNGPVIRNEVEYLSSNGGKAGSSTSPHRGGEVQVESSRDEASVTKKNDCTAKSQKDGEDTQEVEFTGDERNVKGGFSSDINGVCTAPISEGNAVGTEQIPETEGVEVVPNLEGEC
ncbi:unnamed protein product [Fraxinus pennsylvanica]|uniref:Uncharacterized protein n=1 Tax=Fraxinus pennsylvanica TaxID=56036 RepID=A0AAD1ZAM7_9LAMI|nr:unnamed protein product [Fraxinus pennsylvanica]